MSRRIEHSASYPVAAALVHRALTERSYWQARIEEVGGPGAALLEFDNPDDGVQVELTQVIAADLLPTIVQKVKSGDLVVARKETWGPLKSGTAAGSFNATIAGTPIKLRGTHSLRGDDAAATIQTVIEAHVSVPLIGGKIEQIIADNIARLLVIERDFTAQWLAAH